MPSDHEVDEWHFFTSLSKGFRAVLARFGFGKLWWKQLKTKKTKRKILFVSFD